jgi:hypothetical protein
VLIEHSRAIILHGPEQRFVQAFVLLTPAVFPHFQVFPMSRSAIG